MNSNDFIYWLQGFVELTDADSITTEQWLIIKEHLALVVNKETKNCINAPIKINWEEVMRKNKPTI